MFLQDANRIRKDLEVVPRDDRGFTPIERSFYDCVVACSTLFSVREAAPPTDLDHMDALLEVIDDGDILFGPSVRWWTSDLRKYNVADFVLMTQGPLWPSVCFIECDGHVFHERTREQAQRDKTRDRQAIAVGAKTIRFTGQELAKDPLAAAGEALAIVMSDRYERFGTVAEALGHTDHLMKLHKMINHMPAGSSELGRILWARLVFRNGNWVARISEQRLGDIREIWRLMYDLRHVFAYRGLDGHGRMVFRLRLECGQ